MQSRYKAQTKQDKDNTDINSLYIIMIMIMTIIFIQDNPVCVMKTGIKGDLVVRVLVHNAKIQNV